MCDLAFYIMCIESMLIALKSRERDKKYNHLFLVNQPVVQVTFNQYMFTVTALDFSGILIISLVLCSTCFGAPNVYIVPAFNLFNFRSGGRIAQTRKIQDLMQFCIPGWADSSENRSREDFYRQGKIPTIYGYKSNPVLSLQMATHIPTKATVIYISASSHCYVSPW